MRIPAKFCQDPLLNIFPASSSFGRKYNFALNVHFTPGSLVF